MANPLQIASRTPREMGTCRLFDFAFALAELEFSEYAQLLPHLLLYRGGLLTRRPISQS